MGVADSPPDGVPKGNVDPDNPWPGPREYAEGDRRFFYGRDAEVAELLRRVRRPQAVVLYGKSGLGKTSLLQAGLFPELRDHGFFPVRVRLRTDSQVPLSRQVLKRLESEAAAWPEITRVGPDFASRDAAPRWWEYFRVTRFWTSDNVRLVPVLVLDQFEEVLSAPQGRLEELTTQLAELVEDRVPSELRQPREPGEKDAQLARLLEARSACQVLVSLREDYLASFDELIDAIPTLRRNRMRLRELRGLEAVVGPAGEGRERPLLDAVVAEAIVRWLLPEGEDDRREVEELPVDPAFLSLACRMLNDIRRAEGLPEISTRLFDRLRGKLFDEFYANAVRDLSARTCEFIETKLLTETMEGRTSYNEADARRAVAPHAAELDLLRERRVLSRDERYGKHHLELSHDRLVAPVRARRLEREVAAYQRRRRLRSALGGLFVLLGITASAVWLVWDLAARLDEVGERVAALSESEAAATRIAKKETERRKSATRRADSEAAARERAALLSRAKDALELAGIRAADGAPILALDGLLAARKQAKDLPVGSKIDLMLRGHSRTFAGHLATLHDGRAPSRPAIAFDPGGDTLAVTSAHDVRLFKTDDGEALAAVDLAGKDECGRPGAPAAPERLSFGSTGRSLVVATQDGGVAVLRRRDDRWARVATHRARDERLHEVAVDAAGTGVAAISGLRSRKVIAFRSGDDCRLRQLVPSPPVAPDGSLTPCERARDWAGLRFSPDGRWILATSASAQLVGIWDAETGNVQLCRHHQALTAAAFVTHSAAGGDAVLLAVARGSELVVELPADGSTVGWTETIRMPDEPAGLIPDRDSFIVPADASVMRVAVRSRQPRLLAEPAWLLPDLGSIWRVGIDGPALYFISRKGPTTLETYGSGEMGLVGRLTLPPSRFARLVVGPAARRLLTEGADRRVDLWDLRHLAPPAAELAAPADLPGPLAMFAGDPKGPSGAAEAERFVAAVDDSSELRMQFLTGSGKLVRWRPGATQQRLTEVNLVQRGNVRATALGAFGTAAAATKKQVHWRRGEESGSSDIACAPQSLVVLGPEDRYLVGASKKALCGAQRVGSRAIPTLPLSMVVSELHGTTGDTLVATGDGMLSVLRVAAPSAGPAAFQQLEEPHEGRLLAVGASGSVAWTPTDSPWLVLVRRQRPEFQVAVSVERHTATIESAWFVAGQEDNRLGVLEQPAAVALYEIRDGNAELLRRRVLPADGALTLYHSATGPLWAGEGGRPVWPARHWRESFGPSELAIHNLPGGEMAFVARLAPSGPAAHHLGAPIRHLEPLDAGRFLSVDVDGRALLWPVDGAPRTLRPPARHWPRQSALSEGAKLSAYLVEGRLEVRQGNDVVIPEDEPEVPIVDLAVVADAVRTVNGRLTVSTRRRPAWEPSQSSPPILARDATVTSVVLLPSKAKLDRVAVLGADGVVRILAGDGRAEPSTSIIPGKGMRDLVAAPSGRWIALSDGQRVLIWDAEREELRLDDSIGSHRLLALSEQTASGGVVLVSAGGYVEVWRSVGRMRRLQRLPGSLVALQPNGQSVATKRPRRGASIEVARPLQGELRTVPLDDPGRHATVRGSAAFTADGELLRLRPDGRVETWDPKQQRRTLQLVGKPTLLASSRDGRLLATCCVGDVVRLHQRRSDKPRELVPSGFSYPGKIRRLALGPKGENLAALTDDQTLMWTQGSGQPLDVRPGGTRDGLRDLVFSADGQVLLVRGRTDARVYRREVDHVRASLGIRSERIAATHVGPDHVLAVVTTIFDAALYRIDTSTPGPAKPRKVADLVAEDAVASALFSPDGSALATVHRDGGVRIWDTADGRLSTYQAPVAAPTGEAASAMAWSPDGEQLVLASADRRITVWNTETGRAEDTWRQPRDPAWPGEPWEDEDGPPTAVHVDIHGDLVAVAVEPGIARLWQIRPPILLETFRGLGSQPPRVRFSRGGDFLLLGGENGVVQRWSTRPGDAEMRPALGLLRGVVKPAPGASD